MRGCIPVAKAIESGTRGTLERSNEKRSVDKIIWDRPEGTIPNVLLICCKVPGGYWQPGNLKLPMRVCHPAVDEIWPASV